jgi:hypothetical protein
VKSPTGVGSYQQPPGLLSSQEPLWEPTLWAMTGLGGMREITHGGGLLQ